MVPAHVHKKIYQPLKGEESAPEDQVHAHAGIIGDVDELTAPGYTSVEAFAARKADALERMKTQVSLPAEDPAHEKFTKMLTENVAAFVCRFWTDVKVDPVHIEFLPSLPETIRCASRAYPPKILPRYARYELDTTLNCVASFTLAPRILLLIRVKTLDIYVLYLVSNKDVNKTTGRIAYARLKTYRTLFFR